MDKKCIDTKCNYEEKIIKDDLDHYVHHNGHVFQVYDSMRINLENENNPTSELQFANSDNILDNVSLYFGQINKVFNEKMELLYLQVFSKIASEFEGIAFEREQIDRIHIFLNQIQHSRNNSWDLILQSKFSLVQNIFLDNISFLDTQKNINQFHIKLIQILQDVKDDIYEVFDRGHSKIFNINRSKTKTKCGFFGHLIESMRHKRAKSLSISENQSER